MADTRSPEQRRQDELNLAYVNRDRSSPTLTPEHAKAYQAGKAAGRAGWPQTRGVPGMEIHEAACDAAYALGTDAAWRQGFTDGTGWRQARRSSPTFT